MAFEVLPLGVGDTFSTNHNTTALLLRAEGQYLAVDCPDTYLRVLTQAAKASGWDFAAEDVRHMVITHVHGDHMNGLEGFAFYQHFALQRRLGLWVAPEVRAALWEPRLQAPMGQLWNGKELVQMKFEDYFDATLLPWEESTRVGPFEIRIRRTLHHVATSALLVTAEGHTLGYSADTAFDPTLIEFLSAADLVIHEMNFGPAHTAYEDLRGLPERVKSKMRLIHYSDAFDAAASEIALARQYEPICVASG